MTGRIKTSRLNLAATLLMVTGAAMAVILAGSPLPANSAPLQTSAREARATASYAPAPNANENTRENSHPARYDARFDFEDHLNETYQSNGKSTISSAVGEGVFNFSAVVPLDGMDLSELSPYTWCVIEVGSGFHVAWQLGEDPDFHQGRQRATFVETSKLNPRQHALRVDLVWNKSRLIVHGVGDTHTLNGQVMEGGLMAPEYLDASAGRFAEPERARIYFGQCGYDGGGDGDFSGYQGGVVVEYNLLCLGTLKLRTANAPPIRGGRMDLRNIEMGGTTVSCYEYFNPLPTE